SLTACPYNIALRRRHRHRPTAQCHSLNLPRWSLRNVTRRLSTVLVPARVRGLRALLPQADRRFFPGLGHMAVRAWSAEALARRVEWLKAAGVPGGWVKPEVGKGPAYEFIDPDGHPVHIYYETSKHLGLAGK